MARASSVAGKNKKRSSLADWETEDCSREKFELETLKRETLKLRTYFLPSPSL